MWNMWSRAFVVALSITVVLSALGPASAATKRRHVSRNGYGFLPGYEPPEVVAARDRWLYWRRHPTWWYGGPGFYRGRWNGGGFGPCYTQTPIGPIWNCGR
jgi:hypothetical protein